MIPRELWEHPYKSVILNELRTEAVATSLGTRIASSGPTAIPGPSDTAVIPIGLGAAGRAEMISERAMSRTRAFGDVQDGAR